MKTISIDNISDADHTRIEAALKKAYNCDCCEDAIRHFIKQTVQNVEESELMRAKEEEAQVASEAIEEVSI